MTRTDLLREVMRGVLLIVGDYRGSHAELAGYVDRKTGQAIQYVRATHLIECACRGPIDRVVIRQMMPDHILIPEETVFTFIRGRKYVFFLTSLRWERGQVSARMTDREPEELEEEAPGARRKAHQAPLNLV